jgi:hypothetical protein
VVFLHEIVSPLLLVGAAAVMLSIAANGITGVVVVQRSALSVVAA